MFNVSQYNSCIPAPTAPKNVKATVLSPELASVEWTPVPGLRYEVHWRTDESSTSPHKLLKGKNSTFFGDAGSDAPSCF